MNEDLSEYNVTDLEAYAKCVNTLAVENNMSAFLWDCSVYMDRANLTSKYPTCTKEMIAPYGSISVPGNGKDNGIFEEESASTAVKNFGAGWNLGNTLDSTSYNIVNSANGEDGWILKYGKKDSNGNYLPSDWETSWGQVATTQEIADFVLNEGFNAIRIPVTWAEHLDSDNNVDAIWMARVKETVNYFYDKGVYCILNAHHDGGADGWIEAYEDSYTKYHDRFAKLWTQIAEEFKNYDERLLFEGFNEVLDENNNWGDSASGCEWINKWNQLFVDTVRATGGNNAERNLVVMTYAGGGSEFNFSRFILPTDSTENHLIVEVHNYDPQAFTWTTATWTTMTAKWSSSAENTLKNDFAVYNKYADKFGVPVIVGEYCADPKKYADYD